MPRAVLHVRPFLQQEFPRRLRYTEQEASLRSFQHALLHHPEFNFQNLFELGRTQRMEHHRLVNAVHEFRREFPLGGFRRSLFDFLVEASLGFRALQRRESQSAGHQLGNFHAAQIRRHENHRLRQVNSPVVAQVSVALSKIPSSNCHKASEAFSISSNSKNEIFSFSVWYCARASCVIKGCVSRCPKYPGGEPINFAISCECWNSAQSTLITARGSPNSTSAVASTTRVLPAPVGPKNSRFPTGRPGEFSPARNTWYKSTTACTASSCPTIFRRSPASKSRDSILRRAGSNWRSTDAFIRSPSSRPSGTARRRVLHLEPFH